MWTNEKNNLQDHLLPRGEVDPIPDWVTELVVKPLEDCGLIQKVKSSFLSLKCCQSEFPQGQSNLDPDLYS
jgi:hypothetical protein